MDIDDRLSRRQPQDLRRMLQVIMECELGMWGFPVGTWVGDGTQRSMEGERHFGGIEMMIWMYPATPVVTFMVLLTVKAPSKICIWWDECRKVSRNSEHGNWDHIQRAHTPRTCLVRAVSVLLCNASDKDWNHEEELKGCGLGECPLLPPNSVGGDEPSDAWKKTTEGRQCALVPCLIETKTDTLMSVWQHLVTRLFPLLRWYISNLLKNGTLSVPVMWCDERHRGGAKGYGSRVGNLFQKSSRRCNCNTCRTQWCPTVCVNGGAGKTKWKGHREDLGQNLNTVQERCS